MNNRVRIWIPLFLGVFILLCSAANSDAKHLQQIRYRFIDLGTLGGTYSWSTAINNWGQVVGVAETETGRLWAWDVEGPGKVKKEPWPSSNGGRVLCQFPGYRRLDSLARAVGQSASLGEAYYATAGEGHTFTSLPGA